MAKPSIISLQDEITALKYDLSVLEGERDIYRERAESTANENAFLRKQNILLLETMHAGAREGIFPRRNSSNG